MKSFRTTSYEIKTYTPDRLPALLDSKSGFSRKHTVALDLPMLSGEETALWQSRLDKFRKDCGCTAGALALFASFMTALLFVFFQPGGIFTTTWREAVFAIGFVIGATIAGKIFGLWLARIRFKRSVSELICLIQSKEKLS